MNFSDDLRRAALLLESDPMPSQAGDDDLPLRLREYAESMTGVAGTLRKAVHLLNVALEEKMTLRVGMQSLLALIDANPCFKDANQDELEHLYKLAEGRRGRGYV